MKNEGEVISFALTSNTMEGLEEAFRQTSPGASLNGMQFFSVKELGKLLNGNVRDGLATHGVEMVHDPESFSLRAYSKPSPTGTLIPDGIVISRDRQWHLDGPMPSITSPEKKIRIVCTLFGPATPLPAFNVPLGHSWHGGLVGTQYFSSLQFVAEGSSRPQLKEFDPRHNCVSTINADGNRFWHGHVTPKDFEGHENDIYQEHGKAYRRIFLVIDRIVVRRRP